MTKVLYTVFCPVRKTKFVSTDKETNFHLPKTDLQLMVGISNNNEYVRRLREEDRDEFPEGERYFLSRYLHEGDVFYDDPQFFEPVIS